MSAPVDAVRVRRPKRPAAGAIETTRRRATVATVAVLTVGILPAAGYFIWQAIKPPVDDIASVVREYNFDPIVPPNQLRGPGALYRVAGNFYQIVCPADPALIERKLQKSPTADRMRARLENANLSLGGDYVQELNGKIAGARVTSIEYSMKDVAMTEIAMSDLLEIQDALLRTPTCMKIVEQLLQRNEKVCAGSAALSATTAYKVHYDSSLASSAEAKLPIVNALRDKIEADAGSQIRVESEDRLTGDNLYYGIKLLDLCITLDTATEPSQLPAAPPAGGPEVL